jgi:XTP/dITP diphosphohydrolase
VPRTLVIATRNAGKIAELERLLGSGGVDHIRGIGEFPDAREPEEHGESYAENARIKATHAAAVTGLPALADDSGLEVDALGGRPGVYSARFGGPGLSAPERVERLLEELAGVGPERRGAAFRAVVVLAWPDGRVVEAEGVCRGHIARAPRGDGGFGYDPVFLVPEIGRTFAEARPHEKASLDHRGRAIRALHDAVLRACRAVTGSPSTAAS